MAADIREQIDDCHSVVNKFKCLLSSLFDCGFQGNTDNYYDPQTVVDAIFEERRGIPIGLSVILIEVARRLDIELVGISFQVTLW